MELNSGPGRAAEIIARSGALASAFVLLDIGVRDGAHPRWNNLGHAIAVYGFDAAVKVDAPTPNYRYYQMAIGDYDGECGFEIANSPYESHVNEASTNRVPMATLDRLWADGVIPLADFIKIDCEGYEPSILRGASRYLNACNLLGADIETNFNVSPVLTDSHFLAIYRPLLQQRLLVADLALQRIGRTKLARPGTCNVLFCRDFPGERTSSDSYTHRAAEMAPTPETILKSIIILEAYDLVGAAYALAVQYSSDLASLVDVKSLLVCLKPVPALQRFLPHLGFGIWRGLMAAVRSIRSD